MFDVVDLNLAGQWHTPSLGELAELLIFYDRVHIRAPLGRIGDLAPKALDDMAYFRELVEGRRIIVTIDQLPLGEVAWELGLFENPLGMRASTRGARQRLREAFPPDRPAPLTPRHYADKAYGLAWSAEWERLMEKAWEPVQTQPDYFDSLIANAEAKMKLIAEPGFLGAALEAFGATASPTMQALLSNVRPVRRRFEGHPITGLKAPGVGTSAEMFEFLSQADVLLDTIDGREGRDAYTSPDFDRWSRQLVAGSLKRVGVREDISAFQTSVLGRSTIAATIDSEARRFRDIAPLLDKREPFAKAVRNRPVDESLVKAYFEEIQNTSWLTHGPGKVVRFSLFTAAGAALTPITGPGGLAAGAALGAIDAFVVDKLIKGNACRAFVEGTLAPFVATD